MCIKLKGGGGGNFIGLAIFCNFPKKREVFVKTVNIHVERKQYKDDSHHSQKRTTNKIIQIIQSIPGFPAKKSFVTFGRDRMLSSPT